MGERQRINPDIEEDEKDLISVFIKQSIRNKKFESTKMNAKYIRDIVVNFLVAGRDTTAGALSWFFYEMTLNPDVEKKVCDEIVSVILDKNKISYSEIKQLKYTEAAILETLRLHPSVPMESRQAVKDDVLPNGELVRKGMRVCFHPYVHGRSENIWTNAKVFDPKRWLDKRPSDWMYPTFLAGPRKCLGKEIALLEAKMVIACILPYFQLRVIKKFEVKEKFAITLVMEHGLHMNVIRRSN